MQAAKKEHARLLRQKAQNEQQLRTFQSELSELKKTKVRLMKQMKEEAAKNKQQETQRNKEIAQLKKESRLRQMTIKTLETEKRQRDIVLKRKQEEVGIRFRREDFIDGFGRVWTGFGGHPRVPRGFLRRELSTSSLPSSLLAE